MYPSCVCLLLFSLLLRSAVLALVSAAPPPTAGGSNAVSISENGMLQQQNSSSWAPKMSLSPSNTTSTSISVPIIVPISGTDIYLRITYIGTSWFASSLLDPLFISAHEKIQTAVTQQPDDPVAPLPWFHSLHNKEWLDTLAIRVRGIEGKSFTWLQLDWVLLGLLRFMKGEKSMLSHPINFDVNAVGEGIAAAGLLWYSQSPPSRVVAGKGKRRLEW